MDAAATAGGDEDKLVPGEPLQVTLVVVGEVGAEGGLIVEAVTLLVLGEVNELLRLKLPPLLLVVGAVDVDVVVIEDDDDTEVVLT